MTGTGVLWIDGGKFEVQQNHNQHREMSTTGDAVVVLKGTTVVLNQGVGLKYLFYNAFDRSKLFVVDSKLDQTTNWMISIHFRRLHSLCVADASRANGDLRQGSFDNHRR